MTISSVVICCNIPTLIVILKYKRLHTVANIIVFSLSCSDLLKAVTLPLCLVLNFTSVIVSDSHRRTACLICTTCGAISQWTSISNMMVIAVDRYLAVFYSLKYYSIMTRTKAIVIVSCVWVYMTTCSIIFLIGCGVWTSPAYCSMVRVLPKEIYLGFYMTHTILIFLVTLNLHVRVFAQAKKQAAAIERMVIGDHKFRGEREAKVTKAMALVLGVGLTCWTPYTVINALRSALHKSPAWLDTTYKFTFVLLYMNGFLNTIVYARKNKEIRIAYKRLLCCRRGGAVGDEAAAWSTAKISGTAPPPPTYPDGSAPPRLTCPDGSAPPRLTCPDGSAPQPMTRQDGTGPQPHLY